MQDFDTTSTQSLIDRYYEEEKAQREKEQTLASITTRLDASDLAMLSIISKRFRKTREQVAQEVLSSALIDLYSRVDPGERKLMARDADELAKSVADEIAEENGVHSIEFKGGAWANHDRQITKTERKKAKQEEEARKQAEAAKAAANQSAPVTKPAAVEVDKAAGDAVTDDADANESQESTENSESPENIEHSDTDEVTAEVADAAEPESDEATSMFAS